MSDKSTSAGTGAPQGQTIPEQWDISAFPKADYDGLVKLYGKIVVREGDNRNAKQHTVNAPIRAMGLEALRALRSQAVVRWRGQDKAKKAAPFLWTSAQVRERALLVVLGKGKEARHVPVAHLGLDGYTPLTQEQAKASMTGRKAQEEAPPPKRGFQSGWGLTPRRPRVVENVHKAVESKAFSTATKLTGAFVTAAAAYNILGDPALQMAAEAKDWLMRKFS